jgi:hypothetical protein
LRAASGLGDGLGVGREQDGEPQPRGHLDLEAQARADVQADEASGAGDRDQGHQDRGDLNHEHDRVAGQQPGIELAERVGHGRAQEGRIEHAAGARGLAGRLGPAQRDEALEATRAAAGVERHWCPRHG